MNFYFVQGTKIPVLKAVAWAVVEMVVVVKMMVPEVSKVRP